MKNKIYYLGTLSGMVTACGCLFKIMHWPAAGIIIVTGLISLSLVFLPLAIGNMVKTEQAKKLRNFYILFAIVMAINFMVAMMFFFAYFAAITGFLAIGISKNVIDGFVRSAINIENKTMALKENTKLVSMYSDSNNPVNNEAEKLCIKINEVKRMVWQKKLEDPATGSKTFLDARPVIDKRYLTNLKMEIVNFRALVQKQYGTDSRMYRYADKAFEIYGDVSNDVRWEDVWMSDHIIASAIQNLNLLEFKVRLVGMESYDNLKK